MTVDEARLDRVIVRKVFDNVRHNAFTSLARWRDRLYLAFRTADNHANPNAPEGVVTVLASTDDGATWEHVAQIEGMHGMDLRDPKLLATSDRLWLHTFEYQGADRRDAMVTWTVDGESFVPVRRALEEDNHVIWWPATHDGRFWGAGYRYHGNKKDIRSVLFTSDDGAHWRVKSMVYDVPWANESALIMADDGTATVLVRNDGDRLNPPASNGRPVLARSAPPYTEWAYAELDRKLSGLAFVKIKEGFLLAARTHGPDGTRTACFLMPDDAEATTVNLDPLFTLPSGGDTSYAGFVVNDRRVLMSYYSGHEHEVAGQKQRTAIYLAEFDLDDVLG